ncbi:MAG: ABC transporter substrate-binding protein, partial [Spirulinaceae cyanobacterium]
TLDPSDNYELAGTNVIYNLSDTLYAYKPETTELEPQLATEMPEISEDGLTYTIPVREGVTFHDGTPFNAEAMAFSLQRFLENGGKPSFLLSDTIESVEATGDYELTIKLTKPFAAFPALLAYPGTCAISPEAYEIGAGKFQPNTFVGTGPYKLAEFSSDSIRFDVFEDYWGEKPVNEGADMQIYASNSANLFNSFRTGEVDVAYQSLDPNQIKSLQEQAGKGDFQVFEASGTAVSYMVLNLQQEPLDKLEVRQAIATMLDRSLLNQRVLQDQGEAIYSLVPSAFDAYKPAFEEAYGKGNYDQAKELLKKAGYSPQKPATVELWYPSGSNIREAVAATLRALAERELDGALIFEPKSVESATAFSNLPKGIYPSFLVDWYPDFLDADNYLQPFLDCAKGSETEGCTEGAAQNQGSFFYSDSVNELIDQQRQEQDVTKREAIFAEIQEILAEQVPYLPLWQSKDYAFAQNGVEGITMNPSQNFPLWTISK